MQFNSKESIDAVGSSFDHCIKDFIRSLRSMSPKDLYPAKLEQDFIVRGTPLCLADMMAAAKRANASLRFTLTNRQNLFNRKIIVVDPIVVADPIIFDISRVRLGNLLRQEVFPHLMSPEWLNNSSEYASHDNQPENNGEQANGADGDDNLNEGAGDWNNSEQNKQDVNANDNTDNRTDGNNTDNDNYESEANNENQNNLNNNDEEEDEDRNSDDLNTKGNTRPDNNSDTLACDPVRGCALAWHPKRPAVTAQPALSPAAALSNDEVTLWRLCAEAERHGIDVSIRVFAKPVSGKAS